MERQFTEFHFAESVESTAMLAKTNNGSDILISKDWTNSITEDDEAEWEPIVKSMLPAVTEDLITSDNPVTIKMSTAISQIKNNNLVDTTDGQGDLRAQAVLECLIESGVLDTVDNNLVIFDSFDSKSELLDSTSLFIRAVVYNHLKITFNNVVSELQTTKPNNSQHIILSEDIKDNISIDSLKNMFEEDQIISDDLNSIIEIFSILASDFGRAEKDMREYAAVVNKISSLLQNTDLKQITELQNKYFVHSDLYTLNDTKVLDIYSRNTDDLERNSINDGE